MLKPILCLLVLMPTTQAALAQPSGIQLLSARQISADQAKRPHVESYIAVDPRDSQHLLATAMVHLEGKSWAFPYVTFNGGKNWETGRITGDTSITGPGVADPVVSFTNSGLCFFSTLGSVNGVGRSFVARSTDGGRTWSTSTILPNTDRQFLIAESNRGPFGGRTYFIATSVYQSRDGARAIAPFLARSDDGGLTFPFRTFVRDSSNPNAAFNAMPMEPLMTPRGLFVLALQGSPGEQTVERAKRDSLNAWAFGVALSDDGGESFSSARYAPMPRLSVTGSPRRRLRATSAGGFVRTAIDVSSGRFANRIYFVSTDYDPAIDRYVVRVWYTRDFGKNWATTVVSDASRGDVANPAIAVNRDGVVAVTWNDRRDDSKGSCWRLYAALSLDGGERFLPSQRLSEAPTCTNTPQNWDLDSSSMNSDDSGQYLAHFSTWPPVPTRFPMGGDTQGLAADATGVFHAAWINGETGVLQLWHTSFKVDSKLLSQEVPAISPSAGATTIDQVPAGMMDVTRDVRLRVTTATLDFEAHRYTITLEIENRSGRPLHGPLRAIMRHFLDELDNGHGLKNLTVTNADNGVRGIGAAWTFEIPGGILAPGSRSSLRVLSFTFEGGIPEFPEGYLSPGFRVYGVAR